MGIFSGSFTAETGTVTVEIDGAAILTGSGTFYIHDLGKLEFSNEIPNKDEPNPSAIVTKQGGIQVKVRDTLTNGNSFFNILLSLGVGQQLNATLTVNSLPTYLAIRQDGIKYDARMEMVELNLRARWDYMNVGDATSYTYNDIEAPFDIFYDGIATPTNVHTFNNVSGVVGGASVSIHEVIGDWMTWVYGSGSTQYIRSGNRINATSPTGYIIQDFGTPATGNIHLVCPTSAQVGVLSTISRISALEGSTFGNAFGISYYVNRLDTGSDATATFRPQIDYNYVQELALNYDKANIRNVTVTCIDYYGGGVSATADVNSESLTVNTNGSQVYTLDFIPVNAYPAEYSSGNFENVLTVGGADITFDLIRRGVRAYTKALGADGSRRINFKFRNALSLKPYQCFTLSSGTPAVFRASGASSVVYRPSRLYYDFKGDYVEGEAYAIGAV